MAKDPLAPMIAKREKDRKATQEECINVLLKRLADHVDAEPLQYDTLLSEFERDGSKMPFPRVFELALEDQFVEFAPDARGQVSHKFIQISSRGMKWHQANAKKKAKKTSPSGNTQSQE